MTAEEIISTLRECGSYHLAHIVEEAVAAQQGRRNRWWRRLLRNRTVQRFPPEGES